MDLTRLFLHLPWNCSGACAFSVLPEDILSNILAYQPGSGTFSCCSSVLQMHTHVCLTCVTYHWLDQVNGTLLMKAMKISSVVSWFQLGFDLSLFIFIRLSIS